MYVRAYNYSHSKCFQQNYCHWPLEGRVTMATVCLPHLVHDASAWWLIMRKERKVPAFNTSLPVLLRWITSNVPRIFFWVLLFRWPRVLRFSSPRWRSCPLSLLVLLCLQLVLKILQKNRCILHIAHWKLPQWSWPNTPLNHIIIYYTMRIFCQGCTAFISVISFTFSNSGQSMFSFGSHVLSSGPYPFQER